LQPFDRFWLRWTPAWRSAAACLTLLLSIGFAQAERTDVRGMSVACILDQEARHGFPFGLLLAIAKTESSLNWRAYNSNRNGTSDIGIMQINSIHLPRLQRMGITPEKLWHPCVNAAVGAMILREFVDRHGMNWSAVAAYNTGNPRTRPTAAMRYVARVHAHHERILRSRTAWLATYGGAS